MFDGQSIVRSDSRIKHVWRVSRLYPRVVYVCVTHSSLLVELDLSYINHVLTVWPFTLTSACLVTKHFPFGQTLTLVSFFLFSFSTGNAFR